jgi:hypothetical protein
MLFILYMAAFFFYCKVFNIYGQQTADDSFFKTIGILTCLILTAAFSHRFFVLLSFKAYEVFHSKGYEHYLKLKQEKSAARKAAAPEL